MFWTERLAYMVGSMLEKPDNTLAVEGSRTSNDFNFNQPESPSRIFEVVVCGGSLAIYKLSSTGMLVGDDSARLVKGVLRNKTEYDMTLFIDFHKPQGQKELEKKCDIVDAYLQKCEYSFNGNDRG